MTLTLTFEGWCTIRIPTDPDPSDEPRGASGYTFAFAGEPDLDRLIRLQPREEQPELLRAGAPWTWGVFVREARVAPGDGSERPVPGLVGAQVRLLGEPRLENRNWALTPPGKEPIVPFLLEFSKAGEVLIRRDAPLDDNPRTEFWQKDLTVLLAQGAAGIAGDPGLIKAATGIDDSREKFKQRLAVLERLIDEETDDDARVCLQSRRYEVEDALRKGDRRIATHYSVERFSFPMYGSDVCLGANEALADLDPVAPWHVAFWIGAWDCDLLGAYFSGKLSIPYKHAAASAPAECR